jgi:hypothetical protein
MKYHFFIKLFFLKILGNYRIQRISQLVGNCCIDHLSKLCFGFLLDEQDVMGDVVNLDDLFDLLVLLVGVDF